MHLIDESMRKADELVVFRWEKKYVQLITYSAKNDKSLQMD